MFLRSDYPFGFERKREVALGYCRLRRDPIMAAIRSIEFLPARFEI